jgi:hypothetical protein
MVYIYKPMAMGPSTLVEKPKVSGGFVGTKKVDEPVQMKGLDTSKLSGGLQHMIDKLDINASEAKKKKKKQQKPIHFEL